MAQPLPNFYKWLLMFAKGVFKVTPLASTALIFVRLFAQLSAILAFLLPLKIILLLGSDSIPRYFPSVMGEFDRDSLIIALSVAAIAFYILNLIAVQNLDSLTKKAAFKLFTASKTNGVDNASELIRTGYYWFSATSTAALFIILSLAILGVIYPQVAVFSSLFFLTIVLYLIVKKSSISLMEPRQFISNLKIVCSGGFLLTFVFMVAHLMSTMSVNLIVAIVSLLLMRQLFKFFVKLIGGFTRLKGMQEKLMFLVVKYESTESKVDHEPKPTKKIKSKSNLFLAELEKQDVWLDTVINQHQLKISEQMDYTWHDSGTPGVSIININSDSEQYILILYGERQFAISSRELDLLSNNHIQKQLPCPTFIGSSKVNTLMVHVFQINKETHIVDKLSRLDRNTAFIVKLTSVSPDDSFVDKYRQSRIFFWQRLDTDLINQLRIFSTNKETFLLISKLNSILQEIKDELQKLPLVFDNSFAQTTCHIEVKPGELESLRWHRWRLEPMGANLPTNITDSQIKNITSLIGVSRPEFTNVTIEQIRLCLIMASFERSLRRHRHAMCINLLPKILDSFDSAKKVM